MFQELDKALIRLQGEDAVKAVETALRHKADPQEILMAGQQAMEEAGDRHNTRVLIEKPVRRWTIFPEAPRSILAEKQQNSASIGCSKPNPSFREGSIIPLLSDSSISTWVWTPLARCHKEDN